MSAHATDDRRRNDDEDDDDGDNDRVMKRVAMIVSHGTHAALILFVYIGFIVCYP